MTTLQKNEARRFITLLNSLYEACCKLLITAEAGPDDIFSPKIQPHASASPSSSGSGSSTSSSNNVTSTEGPDATYTGTFSKAYQDATEPFRPNISSCEPSLSADALEDDPPNQARRPGSSFTDERRLDGRSHSYGPDFGCTVAFIGEDERFAYKRARSRLWEMCGARWWAREEPGWWKPRPLFAAAVGDASRRAIFYRVDRSSELRWR